MAENILQLRRRNIPRILPARIPLQHNSQAPLSTTPNSPEDTDLDDNNAYASSSPPRLHPATDFDTDSLVDLSQLVTDLATGQFSFEPLPPSIQPEIPEEPLTFRPYESPQWLESFIHDFLAHTISILPHAKQTSEISVQIPDITPPASVSSNNSAEDILTARFATELQILRRVGNVEERYGAAYVQYTRYQLLSQVANAVGLHIHKPSRKATLGVSDITYNDLFHRAGMNPDSFANIKTLIATAENIRQVLINHPL
ncbi:hypothetical protein K438DRAFT_1996178 [Mycena galopus ATCC 62051]|nr:hypothetical protein K438DRAFT_1996178 [Mycena galopus ATCC 62051]